MTTDTTQQVYRLSKGHRLQWEEAQNAHVILYPEGMVTLNESAGAVLNMIDGKLTTEEIISQLEQQFPDADLRDDVLHLLETSASEGWISDK